MRAMVTGNLVRDPELKFTNSGKAVCGVSIADNYKSAKDAEPEVTFIDVVVWGTLAENVAGSLKKGQRVFCEGRVKERKWETQEGQKRTKLELIADVMGPDLRWQSVIVDKAKAPSKPEFDEDPF